MKLIAVNITRSSWQWWHSEGQRLKVRQRWPRKSFDLDSS